MAESRVSGPKGANVPCRYFAKGKCTAADSCSFLHQPVGNMSNASDSSTSRNETRKRVCKYFHQGACRFGESCMFRHEASSLSDLSNNAESSSPRLSTKMNVASSSSSRGSTMPTVPKPILRSSSSHNGTGSGQNNKKTGTKSKRENLNSPHASTSVSSSDCDSDTSKENVSPAEEDTLSVLDSRLNFNAPEFIPSYLLSGNSVETEKNSGENATGAVTKSWAQIVSSEGSSATSSKAEYDPNNVPLCPYAEVGDCPFAEDCQYLHGDICEFCGLACLHPFSEKISKQHTRACIKQHEIDMEHSMAVARSQDKICGVCFETIMEKKPIREQRFGILPNCNHCFCLACIRKWRQATQFENKIIRACPECRVTSDFVCPSLYWVDTKEDKDKLFKEYKKALSAKKCKYFQEGKGECPFGNKCFYQHAYPDGTKVDLGPPVRRKWQDANGDVILVDEHLLWEFGLDRDEGSWLDDFDDETLEEILLDTLTLSRWLD